MRKVILISILILNYVAFSQSYKGTYFYKTYEDYLNKKPISGPMVKPNSLKSNIATGTSVVIVENGKEDRVSCDKLPHDLFLYYGGYMAKLIKVVGNTPYRVFTMGKMNYYADLFDEQRRFYQIDSGTVHRFKKGELEEFLKDANLLEEFKNTYPKREKKDDVNGYFNKVVNHEINFIDKMNQKNK
ncbi:MAG: hypothetical protein IT237_03390 [Bacteroidia bacterium]|nr:hypothetical protein [Bacteroidia bacterium]